MGCRVAWNTAERTWDCPCYGSRFTPDGAVRISGQLRAKAFDTFLFERSPGRSGNPHPQHQLRTLLNAQFRFLAHLRSPSRHLIPQRL